MSFLVLIVAALVAGTWALRPLGMGSNPEGLAYRGLVGLLLCAVGMLVIGSVSLRLTLPAMCVLAAVGLGYELFVAARHGKGLSDPDPDRRPMTAFEYVCLGAIIFALTLALVSALAPVTSWDAGVAHAALPSDYAREGRIMLVDGNAYSAYPHLMHVLYAGVFFESGETAASLLSWTFGVLGCVMVYGLGRRVENRRCGLIAAAILATAPIFLDQAGAVSLDIAFATTTAAALTSFLTWRDERKRGWLLLAAFLAGSSCGIRHTGYLVCVLLCIATLLNEGPGRLRALVCFAGMSVLAASPWLLRSAILVGNPVYPFLASVVSRGGPIDWDVAEIAAHKSIRGIGLTDLLMFPWNIIMRPHWYDGWSKSPGGLLLVLGPVGLVVGGKRARGLCAFSAAGGVCFFYFQRLARYLLPFFVPMMVVAAVAACRLKALRKPVAVLLVIAFAYGLALHTAAVCFKLPVALKLETRDDYLTGRVERYQAFKWVSRNIDPDRVVLTLDPRTYYIAGRTYEGFEALKVVQHMAFPEQMAWLAGHQIDYLLVPETYMKEGPGFRDTGVLALVDSWLRHERAFVCIKAFELNRPRTDGTETVKLYEVRHREFDPG